MENGGKAQRAMGIELEPRDSKVRWYVVSRSRRNTSETRGTLRGKSTVSDAAATTPARLDCRLQLQLHNHSATDT